MDEQEAFEEERKAARADPRQTTLFEQRRLTAAIKGALKNSANRRARNMPVTLAGKPRDKAGDRPDFL